MVADAGVLAVVKLKEAVLGEVGIPNRNPVFGDVSSIVKKQTVQSLVTFLWNLFDYLL